MIEDPSSFRRYLLGALDEPEKEALEKRLMTSDEHFEELLIAEDELVDDYWARQLDASEERDYLDRFLVTSERHQQHRFGAALRRHVSAGAPAMGRFRMALAVAAVMLIAFGVWKFTENAPVRLEQTAQLAEGPTRTVYLASRRLRSFQPQTQTIPVSDELAVVELELPTDAPGDYGVTIEDARSDRILAEGTLPARTVEGQWIVVAAVPSELLSPGVYRAVLRSPSDETVLATYEFRTTSE